MAGSRPILPEDLEAFTMRFEKLPDLVCALVPAALLDAQLESLLGDNQKTFNSRIKAARTDGKIDGDIESDLDTIRKIRNEFAHSFDHDLSFTSDEVSTLCEQLRCINAMLESHDEQREEMHKTMSLALIKAGRDVLAAPRNRFLMAAHFIAQLLQELLAQGRNEESLIDAARRIGKSFGIRVSARVRIE